MRKGRPTVAVLAQQLDDHLQDCASERQRTNKALTRIWMVLLAVFGSAFLQLLAASAFLFVHAYPPSH